MRENIIAEWNIKQIKRLKLIKAKFKNGIYKKTTLFLFINVITLAIFFILKQSEILALINIKHNVNMCSFPGKSLNLIWRAVLAL
jgi:hypothetical protein